MAQCEKLDTHAMEEVDHKISQANKGDPMGYMTLPLMLWTIEDENIYNLFIRTKLPKFVRAVVCNTIFYYKGASALLPFVPRYRGTWDI